MAGDHCCAADCIALDRAASARSYDEDGHLRVKGSLLSRSEVSPYKGSEIPDSEKLGLEPSKVYKLWRHPEELKKGAPTLDGKPLLLKHQPITADDHPTHITAGAISNPQYSDGELRGDLTVWLQDAITGIDDKSKRHLSMGYRYEPEMTSGTTPDGEDYDGVMRNIRFNHGALVDEPRVKGAVVADSAEELQWLALDLAIIEAFDTREESKHKRYVGVRVNGKRTA